MNDYYEKPSRKKERIINTSILNYYESLDNEQEPVQEPVQQPVQEPVQEAVQEQEYDGMTKNKSAMKRTLNLYNVLLKPMEDDLKPWRMIN